MASPEATRRAVAAAQAVLKEVEPSMQIDGKAGTFTLTAYQKANPSLRDAVDRLMAALGAAGSIPAANQAYRSAVRVAVSAPTTASAKRTVFDLQVVPAVVREARRRGLNPSYNIAQLALETRYGEATPMLEDGTPSYNYGGIKWNTVRTPRKVTAMTSEYVNGKFVRVNQDFAVFATPEDFAQAYFGYLFTKSKRYPGLDKAKTGFEYGSILQKGGYATDPQYASKFASVVSSVEQRYSLA